MNRIFLPGFISLIVLAFVPKLVFAQTFDAKKAFEDYQFSLGVYTQNNTDFKNAKDFYLTNKTLTLKEDARKKLLVMLRSRDQLESVYLTAIRMRILETKGLSDSDKNSIFDKIDKEIAWYKDHMGNYKESDPAEDLFNKSSESENRYTNTTTSVIYESLFTISLGEGVGIRQDSESVYSNLKSLVTFGVGAGKIDMNPFNRWFTDIDSVVQTLKQNEDLSKNQIQKVYDQYNSGYSAYTEAVGTLSASVNSLTQLNNFLTEVLTSIKNQQ